MNTVKIEVSINPNDDKQLKATLAFLKAIGASAPEVAKKAPVKEEAEKEAEPVEEKIEIKDVRALLSKKVADHRTEIKEKLTELGANNVTSLDEKHYPAFMDFLNNFV